MIDATVKHLFVKHYYQKDGITVYELAIKTRTSKAYTTLFATPDLAELKRYAKVVGIDLGAMITAVHKNYDKKGQR